MIRLAVKCSENETLFSPVNLYTAPKGKPFFAPFDSDGRLTNSKSNDSGTGLRILVVEDEPINRKVASGLLEKKGFMVEIACNGQEAIDLLKAKTFDLVLMDIQMPVIDGLDASRRIREGAAGEDKRGIPIVAFTAHCVEEFRQKCYEAGMDGLVTKPVNREHLYNEIKRCLKGNLLM